jgi:hypothetical protein
MQLQVIQKRIYELRGQKVMLDFDLAELYETEAKRLKEAVRRNADRFPDDFMFEITRDEYDSLRTQIASSKNAEGQKGRGGRRYLPYAFTEQGVAMLASVLNSPKAIQVNISIVRAFVMLRQLALTYKELALKIGKMERKYNKQFADVYEALDLLLKEKEIEDEWKERKPIGYKK